MKLRIAAAFWLALSLVAVAGDPPRKMQNPEPPLAGDPAVKPPALTLDPEVKPLPGHRLVTITAKTTGEIVKWKMPAAIDGYLPIALDDVVAIDKGKTIKFPVPERAGRYTIEAHTAVGNESFLAETTLVVGTPPPNPTPTADAFAADLKKLFAEDPDPAKRQSASALAGVYRVAVKGANDKSVTSIDQLMGLIADAAGQVAEDKLAKLRARIIAELAKLGDGSAALTDDLRARIADIYDRAQKALDEAAKS